MKEFFNGNIGESIATWLDGTFTEAPSIKIPQEIGPAAVSTLPAACATALRSLNWFWRFSCWKTREIDAEQQYEEARTSLLSSLCAMKIRMTPALHYITNHLWEDYINYGPLWHLMEDGAEAVHSVHNQFCKVSTRGRRQCYKDKHNAWGYLLCNLAAAVSLVPVALAKL